MISGGQIVEFHNRKMPARLGATDAHVLEAQNYCAIS